jgi:hypothetical protein
MLNLALTSYCSLNQSSAAEWKRYSEQPGKISLFVYLYDVKGDSEKFNVYRIGIRLEQSSQLTIILGDHSCISDES